MGDRGWAPRYCRWLKLAFGKQNKIGLTGASCDTLLVAEKSKKHRVVIPWSTHFKDEYKKVSNLYAKNRIRTTKYRLWSFIPRNLFEQFHRLVANLYFLFIALLNWVPAVEAFRKEITMIPLCVVLTIIAVKDALEDYTKYKLDKKINNFLTRAYCRSRDYVDKFWSEVSVGDFIRLACNEEIPADMILIYSSDGDGICHIETSSLDGETNLKQRQVVKGFAEQAYEINPEDIICRIECETPNNDLNSFRGFIENVDGVRVGLNKDNLLMRGCIVRNTEAVVGIVVYAGHETKAMLNTTGARYKRSKLEKRMNRDILWCVLLLIVMCFIGAIGHRRWLRANPTPPLYASGKELPAELGGFLMFWTMIILLQVLIPISLYVSIEFVKLGQIFLIRNDIDLYDEVSDRKIQCGSLNIAEDLGQIEYIFSDKTGTLTENKMVFRRCSIAGLEYGHEENGKTEAQETEVAYFSSHSSLRHASRARFFSRKSSEFLNSRIFRSSSSMGFLGWRQLAFSSPLETDVVPDMRLVKKVSRISPKAYSYPDKQKPIPEIVYITEFFIALAICNTVVVSAPDQPRLRVRTENREFKSSLFSILIIYSLLHSISYSIQFNSIPDSRFSILFIPFHSILLFFSHIKPLEHPCAHVTKIWILGNMMVITSPEPSFLQSKGPLRRTEVKLFSRPLSFLPDQETCTQKLKSILEEIDIKTQTPKPRSPSGAVAPSRRFALIINGPTLEFALHRRLQNAFMQLARKVRAVICCRATPLQKSKMVKQAQKELQVMTLAVGDGANDVSMIQVADIGIGISGQEGMQAVLASDFAISQFQHLRKLLFVHGHWCYTRLANMILYFFYKNLAYVSLLFWYQFFCGFSGTPMIDYWSLIFFNLLFTSVPPVIYGVFDKDVSAETLMKHPELYKASQKNQVFILGACYIMVFFPLQTFLNSDVDTIIHFSVFAGSIFLYFFILGLLGAFCVLCNPPANPYWIIQRQLMNPMFYLDFTIAITLALLPRFLFWVIKTTMFPSPLLQARIRERQSRARGKSRQ
uniref:Phospholipid-transporting ATPase n=1 Tax=Naja naja TaxID=35670 RepID=A0A8C6XW15_NAJNA